VGDINEVISVDAGPGIAGLKEFTAALEDAAGKWADFQAKLSSGLGGGGADKLGASMDQAAASISAAADRAAASLDRIGAAADPAAAGLERLDEAAVTAEGSLASAAAGADEAAAASDRLAESADAAGAALDRQAASGEAAGATAAEAGAGGWKAAKVALLGLGVAAAYGIDKAMKFQSQMLLLNTQAGVSMPKVKQMSQGVLEISTQTGQSLSDVSESAYHVASNMASMGTTVPRMLSAVKVAAEGAAVGHANMVDVTNALTAAIASGIPGVKNYSQAMGVLNSTVGSGDMSMQDLADAFSSGLLATVKGYGLNIKDVGAALATFGDNNIRGAKAGTDLRVAVEALAVPVKTGAAELKKLGLNSLSFANDMKSGGLLKALDDLNGRFKANGITAKDEGEVITTLFGKKAGAGISVLLEQMDRLQSKYPDLTKGADDFGKAWEKTQQSPAQKWKEATAGFQAAAVNFGTQLLPAFNSALGVVNRILAAINSSGAGMKGLAAAFGGIAALFTAKKLVGGIESAFKTGESVLRGVGKISQVLHIPGLDKLANLGQGTGLNAAAADLTGAAADLSAAAEKLGGAGVTGEAGGAEGAAAKGGGGLAGLGAALPWAGLGAAIGAGIKAVGDKLAPAGTTAGAYNAMLQKTPATNASSLMPSIFGGFEGKLMSSIGPAVGGAINSGIHFAAGSFDTTRHQVASVGHDVASFFGFGGGAAAPKPVKVPAPDLSLVEAAKGKAAQAMAGITTALDKATKPAKIAGPDLSLVEAAKGKAAQAAAGITTAMKTPLDKPVKAAAPDLSAYAAAKGKAAADGAAIDQGLASGILAGEGTAVAAANQVAAAVEAAMAHALQTHSPSKVTEKIGKDTVAGLVLGLEGGQAAVNAAATALGKQVAKAADITSIDNTVTKLMKDVPKGDTGLTKMLTADQGKLTALAAQRAKLETEISDAQQIAQQAISSASILNTTYTPALAASNGPTSAYQTISGLQAQAGDQSAFASQIAQLKKMGLNATSLNQLIQGGAQQGLPVAQGLTQGGKSAIAQVNALEAQIHASAAKIGSEGAGPMYQAGVQAAQGLAAGLKSQLGAVDQAIKQLAEHMVAAIKAALKSKSPSLVFRDVGLSIPQGLAMGVDAGSGIAEAAVGRMGSRLSGAHPGLAYGHAGGHGAPPAVHVTNNVTVMGTVTSERDLLDSLQELQLAKADRNWQGGWTHPGRAG